MGRCVIQKFIDSLANRNAISYKIGALDRSVCLLVARDTTKIRQLAAQ